MKVLNWNTQADRLSVRTPRFERSRQLVARHDADVICLTEAFPESMPEGGETVTSGLSEWKRHEDRGARKVVLWSRFGWTDVDRTGSESLPKGRFVSCHHDIDRNGPYGRWHVHPVSRLPHKRKMVGNQDERALGRGVRLSGRLARRYPSATGVSRANDTTGRLQLGDTAEGVSSKEKRGQSETGGRVFRMDRTNSGCLGRPCVGQDF